MSTHKDWEAAKEKRNSKAIQAARELHQGRIEKAKALAAEAMVFDDKMALISKELDG